MNGMKWHESLKETRRKFAHIPANTFEFVEHTMQVVEHGSTAEVGASFLFGREDPIPTMFQKLLSQFNKEKVPCDNLKLYLQRHIDVDEDSHGPMADLMLGKLCTTEEKCEKALNVVKELIEMRVHLWDGIYSQIKN